MAFPATKTNAQDGTTEIIASHLNNLEDYVGVTGSADSASLTYKLSNTASGHDHDGVDSKKVLVTNLDVSGLTALRLLRVNSGATAVEGVVGPTGVIVGDTDTQTLTNKTLTSPTITTPTLTLKQSSSPTPTTEGEIQWDTDDNQIKVGDGSGTKTFVDRAAMFDIIYPVGSIYVNATSSTNPGTLLGFGTWTAFGAGRVMVGLNSGDTDFDTAEETGGEKTHTLTTAEMPAHTHNVEGSVTGGSGGTRIDAQTSGTTDVTSSAGSSEAHNNLQPYIVVYMWKRTA